MAVPDVAVQRGTTFFASGETSVTQTITAVAGLTSAFVRVTNVANATRGDGSNIADAITDFGVACELTDTSTITFERGANAADITVYWEVIEYTGAAGGPNEWIVRHQAIEDMTGASLNVTLDTEIGTLTDSVIEIGGVHLLDGSATNQAVMGSRLSTTQITLTSKESKTRKVGVAVLEYTGSAWTVGYDEFTTDGASTTETFDLTTAVADWAKTLLVMSHWQTNQFGVLKQTMMIVWPATVSTIKKYGADGSTVHTFTVHTIEHADLVVEHDDSRDGSLAEYASGAIAQTFPITAVTPGSASVRAGLATVSNTNDRGAYWPDYALVNDAYMDLAGVSGDYFSTADSATNSITLDIDIRFRIRQTDWSDGEQTVVGKYHSTGNNRSYSVSVRGSGVVRLVTSADGSATISAQSTAALSTIFPHGEWAYGRVTLDVDDGAGNRVYKFYTSADKGVTWDLWDTSTVAGTTSIYDGTAKVEIGSRLDGTNERRSEGVGWVEIRDGIDGTLAVNFQASEAPPSPGAWQSSTVGETWVWTGAAAQPAPVQSGEAVDFRGAFTTSVASDIALQVISFAGIVSADTATPLVQLATRAPTDRQFPPVDAAYVQTLNTDERMLRATPIAGAPIEFTGSFRLEFDVVLPEHSPSDTIYTFLEVGPAVAVRIRVSWSSVTHILVLRVVGPGGTAVAQFTKIFTSNDDRGIRIRFACSYVTGSGLATLEFGETASADLESTSWTTDQTDTIIATTLKTNLLNWNFGADVAATINYRLIQFRAFDEASGSTLVADVVAADGADSKIIDRVNALDFDYQNTCTLYPYGDWEDITSSVRYRSGIKTKRGRSTDLGNMNAGTMTLTLDSLTRDFEPENTDGAYSPAIAPFTPVRFIAIHAEVLLPLWRGFVRSWTPVYDTLDAVTIMQCVDGFRPLNLKQTGAALTAAITDLVPVGFWPLIESSGTFSDDSVNSNDLTLAGSATYQGAQVTIGDRRLALLLAETGEAVNASPSSEVLTADDSSFCAAILITERVFSNDGMTVVDLTGAGIIRWSVRNLPSGSSITMGRYQPPDFASVVAFGGPDLDDGRPHIIAGTYDDTSKVLNYYLDGVLVATETGEDDITVSLSSGGVIVGGIDSEVVQPGGLEYVGGLGFVGLWDRVLTDYEATTLTSTRLDGSAEGPPGTRIDDLLDLAEWPVNERSIETGSTTLVAKDASDTQVLAEIQTSETADIGEFFIAANGYATYRARGWRATNRSTSQATFGDQSPELPYTNLAYDFNETRIVNHWETTPADGDTGVAVDLTSIQQFGRRKQTQTLDLLDGDAAQTYADNRLAARKDPDLIVRQLSIAASRDAVNLLPVLLGTEISDRYTITRRPPGGGDPISNDAFVESISIECRSETEWYFILELSPLL